MSCENTWMRPSDSLTSVSSRSGVSKSGRTVKFLSGGPISWASIFDRPVSCNSKSIFVTHELFQMIISNSNLHGLRSKRNYLKMWANWSIHIRSRFYESLLRWMFSNHSVDWARHPAKNPIVSLRAAFRQSKSIPSENFFRPTSVRKSIFKTSITNWNQSTDYKQNYQNKVMTYNFVNYVNATHRVDSVDFESFENSVERFLENNLSRYFQREWMKQKQNEFR